MDDKRAPRSRHRRLERINAVKNVEYEPSSVHLAIASTAVAVFAVVFAVSADTTLFDFTVVFVAFAAVAVAPSAVAVAFAVAVAAVFAAVVPPAAAAIFAIVATGAADPPRRRPPAALLVAVAFDATFAPVFVVILAAFAAQKSFGIRGGVDDVIDFFYRAFGLTWSADFAILRFVWADSRTHSDLPHHSPPSSSSRTEGAITVSPNGTFKRVIRSWTKGKHLGSGSFGTVYEAISYDGFFFAVKEVSLLDQGNNAEQCIFQLEQEIMLLSRFQHENIVEYFGTEKAKTTLYVFLELVSQGSLASLYLKYPLQNSQVSAYTRQILNGLNYLHQQNVVHRDIKCANILVDSYGAVKLADFGLAKETTKLNELKSCKGSVYWMAPEVVRAKRAKPYGRSADIWSLGCTVLEMLTGRLPYPNTEWNQALYKIGHDELPPIPESLTTEARDFIKKCLQVVPSQRPSAAQLLEHPFVKRPAPSPSGSDLSL